MASVTGALRRMSKEGLVHYGAREFVELTDQGAELARKVLQRNDFLRRFLTGALGLDLDTAERDACAIEHHLSSATLARLAAFYQYLETYGMSRNLLEFLEDGVSVPCEDCPKTERPSQSGQIMLTALEPGTVGQVAWLDGDASHRLDLVEKGIMPRVRVSMEAHHAGAVRVRVKGSVVNLTEEQAAAVRVTPLAE